ncbi:MAG TPA: hemerythrin domain-containing protein [Chitinophagaceae bacterium]|nr:hemerythrin domain-containing protein [Chitinophagaceae bacterium]
MEEERKPVKRSPQLAPLSREHHEGLLFAWKIQQGLINGADIKRMREYTLWYWQQHIKPHFYQEEKILQPYLSAENKLLQRMKKEHEKIRELVLNVDKDADNPDLITLAKVVNDHIRFEERELFAYLEQILSRDQLDAIFTKLEEYPVSSNHPSAARWKDEFWLKRK